MILDIQSVEVDDEMKSLTKLKEILNELGGWPLVEGTHWNHSNITFDFLIQRIRRLFGYREDEIFDISSRILVLRHAYLVSYVMAFLYLPF